MRARLVPDEDGFLWMSADSFAKAVAPESPAGDAVVMAATQKPIAVSCLGEKDDQTSMEREREAFLVSYGGKGPNDCSRHSAIYGS